MDSFLEKGPIMHLSSSVLSRCVCLEILTVNKSNKGTEIEIYIGSGFIVWKRNVRALVVLKERKIKVFLSPTFRLIKWCRVKTQE